MPLELTGVKPTATASHSPDSLPGPARSKTGGTYGNTSASLHVKRTLACIASSASGAGSLERDEMASTGKKAEQNDQPRTDARNGDTGGRWSLFCASKSSVSLCVRCTRPLAGVRVSVDALARSGRPSRLWPDACTMATHLFEQTNHPELLIK